MNCQCNKFGYSNFEEKHKLVYTPPNFVIDNSNSLLKIIEEYNNEEYIFRGVNNSSYKIYSSLHYHLLKKSINPLQEAYRGFIHDQLHPLYNHSYFFEYFLKSLKSIENINTDKNNTEIFVQREVKIKLAFYLCCLLQHYGGKTPFVDFTKDIRIALFFSGRNYSNNISSDKINDYVSIYLIPRNSLNYLHNNNWRAMGKDRKNNSLNWSIENIKDYLNNDIYNEHNEEELSKIIDNLFFKENIGWLEYEDFLFNYNVIAQKGCFVIYQNLSDKSLEERYLETSNNKILCLEVNKKLIPEIIDNILVPNNINEDMMFPNVEDIVNKAFKKAELELQKVILAEKKKI